MNLKIIIDGINPRAIIAAYTRGDILYKLVFESEEKANDVGSIYSGRVSNIVESLEAYFVDYGAERSGFLPFNSYPKLLTKNENVIVQVMKNEKKGKGARLTGFVSLTGKYSVYMPYGPRLKSSIAPIIRQRFNNISYNLLEEDLKEIKHIWKEIVQRSETLKEALLYKEKSIVDQILRDSHTSDVTIFTNSKQYYEILRENMQHERVIFHDSKVPIFYTHNVIDDIRSLAEHKISLKCGGSIVIDQTEAMVTIDVNSSSAGHRCSSLDENSYRVNMQAAAEIAKQIRLRNLSGIIAIDFIDMNREEYILEVEREFRDTIKDMNDSIRIAKINEFGVLMLSKKRSSFSANEYLYEKYGSRSVISLASEILWEIQLSIYTHPGKCITVECSDLVAMYLLNNLRKVLTQLENVGNNEIRVISKQNMLNSFTVTPLGLYEPQILPIYDIHSSKKKIVIPFYTDYPPLYQHYIVSSDLSFIGIMQ